MTLQAAGQEFKVRLVNSGYGSGLKLPDAIQKGIGQGPVSWTPLHAAAAYATIARGGVKIAPRLIMGLPRSEPVDIGLSAAAVAEAMDGLSLAVNNKEGTGNQLNIEDNQELIFN